MAEERHRILLVEDNPGDARLAAEVFKERAHKDLYVVEDGAEALAFLRREGEFEDAPRPDLVLLDLNLPRKDGNEVLNAIKGDDRLRRIPVIVLTSSQDPDAVTKAYDLNANCYVTKPLDFDRFERVMRAIEDFWLTIAELPKD
jgi:two-component system, chemotaxis family, response regulator Rcp1